MKQKEKDWFKDRGYLHLTNKTPPRQRPKLASYFSDSIKVAKHRFSPFILRNTTARRLRFSKELGKKSHKAIDDVGNVVSNAKVRPIEYATHIDSNLMSFYAHKKIRPLYENALKSYKNLDESITAYRRISTDDEIRFKYNVDFAKDVFDEIKRRKDCAVLAFDIKSFFPSINHKLLKTEWCSLLGTKSLPKDHYAIYKAMTNYSYIYYDDLRLGNKGNLDEKKIAKLRNQGKFQFFRDYEDIKESGIQVYKNEHKVNNEPSGIPHGLPLSALMANVYMLPFDKKIIDELVIAKGCFYRRYSDDLVIVCDQSEMEFVENFVMDIVKQIKLKIAPEKTEKFIFKNVDNRIECCKLDSEGLIPNSYLQYLGFDFYGYKTLIKAANLASFYRDMKESIAMKAKRVQQVQEKYLTDQKIIYKRRLYRLYSYKGVKSRQLEPCKKLIYENGNLEQIEIPKKYRGNFIKYAYRASDIMEAPEIRRQVRRHMIILKKYMSKFEFDNAPNKK
jgi:hypothetical protein